MLPYLKAKHPEIPIIDYVHMEEWYWRNGGYARDSAYAQNVIDKTFTCNENSRNIFIKHYKRKKSGIETMYIGVDERKFNPDIFDKNKIIKELKRNNKIKTNQEKILKEKSVISYICRIVDQKRPYLFFEIIKKLAQKRKDFVIVIAGDGPLLEGLKKKVTEAKLDSIVIFLGNQKDTEKIYKISDLTVNTSIKEGLALTSYESLSMGVPVVSSDVGGQKELITEDVGIVVPCIQEEGEILNLNYTEEEINGYVNAIEKILNNLKKYKSKCRERILNGFTIDNMIERMEKEFEKIAKNPKLEKVIKGKELSGNIDILKELISTYFVSSKSEYEWLVSEFNRKNIHKIEPKRKLKKSAFYEHTLEYKLKHPIVVALRKIGVYDNLRNVIYKKI